MKTEDILNLDYTKEENRKTIQKVLSKIKPLSKFSGENEIPIEAIEKFIRIIVSKYEVVPQWMMMSFHEVNRCIYSMSIKSTKNGEWLGTVYGVCLYEVFAKLAIKIYSEIKTGKVGRKEK